MDSAFRLPNRARELARDDQPKGHRAPPRAVEPADTNGVARLLALLRSGLIPGLVRLVVQVFKHILHTMEAILFKVDEWLRFRRGGADSHSQVFKSGALVCADKSKILVDGLGFARPAVAL